MLPSKSMLIPREISAQEANPLGFLQIPQAKPAAQPNTSQPSGWPKQYEKLIQQAARMSGLPAKIIMGLIKQESNWNPKARSKGNAQGLVQITPTTLAEFAREGNPIFGKATRVNPWDPNSAIPAMGAYLKHAMDKFKGDRRKAITSYNAGLYYDKPRNREQREYFDKVMANAIKYGHRD